MSKKQEVPNFYDDLMAFDPEEAARQKADRDAQGARLDYLIHRTFCQTEEGRELLSLWKETLIMTPGGEPGADLYTLGINEGLKRFIRSILLTNKRVEEGR